MVQKMMAPNGWSATALAAETGVAQPTLSRWLREARSVSAMSKPKSGKAKKKSRTFVEKMRVVVEASELSEEELGAYLRREGVHEAQLEQWRKAAQEALGSRSRRAKKKSSGEKKRIQELERDLRRKEKALAEATALLLLKKKVSEIWGDEDDDTTGRSGK